MQKRHHGTHDGLHNYLKTCQKQRAKHGILLEWLVKKEEKKLKLKIKTNSVVVVDIMQRSTAFKTMTDKFQSIFFQLKSPPRQPPF